MTKVPRRSPSALKRRDEKVAMGALLTFVVLLAVGLFMPGVAPVFYILATLAFCVFLCAMMEYTGA